MDALKLTARHVWEFYFPPRWLWAWESMPDIVRPAITWAIAFVGLVALGLRLARRDWRYVYVAAAVFLPMLPYVVADPWVRYRYPVGGILVFLAADLIWRLAQSVVRRRDLARIPESAFRAAAPRRSPAVS